jgi:hypothetical protein
MIFLVLKIAGIWLILVALLLRGNHRAHRRKVEALSEPRLPLNAMFYANRFGVYRYEGEEMRRFALEYDLLERGGEL